MVDLVGPASITSNNLALGIGAQSDGATTLQGAMDDALLFNTALTASEIAALATITPGNGPPTLNPVGNKSAEVGTQLAFTATATDPNAGDTLTFSLANGTSGSVPAGAAITSGGAFTWTPIAGQIGSHVFDVCVSDGTVSDCETITVTVSAAGTDPVLVGAGDIAGTPWTQDGATATLVSGIPGTVFTLGDNAYPNGTADEFSNYYDPTWGAFKARTRPSIGNHEFGNGVTANATPYYDYFNGVGIQNGPAGDRGLGYYSYNIGSGASTWHIVVLNSECEPGSGYWLPGGCDENSAQDLWLENDLATSPTNNIIAMMHKPRYSSSGNFSHLQHLWQDLYEAGADIALGGHWHNYERMRPANASGNADDDFGIRQFVVGTGGVGLTGFGTIRSTSEERNQTAHGVHQVHAARFELRLPVHPDRRPVVHRLGEHRCAWCTSGGRPRDVHDDPRHGLDGREAAVQALAARRNLVGGPALRGCVPVGHVDLAPQPGRHLEQRPPYLDQDRRSGRRQVRRCSDSHPAPRPVARARVRAVQRHRQHVRTVVEQACRDAGLAAG